MVLSKRAKLDRMRATCKCNRKFSTVSLDCLNCTISSAAAIEGHEWELDEMTTPVRYIRIRMVENWDTSKRGLSGMSEINLYGQQIVSAEELKAQEAAAGSPRRQKR